MRTTTNKNKQLIKYKFKNNVVIITNRKHILKYIVSDSDVVGYFRNHSTFKQKQKYNIKNNFKMGESVVSSIKKNIGVTNSNLKNLGNNKINLSHYLNKNIYTSGLFPKLKTILGGYTKE